MSDPEVKETHKKKEEDDEEVVLGVEPDSSDSAVHEDNKKRDVLTHQADDKPMRFISFDLFGSEVNLNPFTSFFGFAFLWALSIWCMVVPERKYKHCVQFHVCLLVLTGALATLHPL